jgi:radical SAM protein with 4Fe4S-binding SPASM domain
VDLDRIGYADFSLRLHTKVQGQRVPLSGTIELTRRCPLECVHCYNSLPMRDETARSGELTTDEHCRILDEIAAAGCLWLLCTGGEIFARHDFIDIYTYAKKKGFLVTLFTNGTLITPKMADYLAEWPPFLIEISVYGATKKTLESITGVSGSYERCMRGIRLLAERGLPLRLKTMALTINRHEISEMKRIAEEEFGLEFRFDAMINPRIDRSDKPLSVRLSPDEVVDLDMQDPKRMSEWSRFCERFNGPLHLDESDSLYHCGGGINSFAIDPYGLLRICGLSTGDAYDLRRGTFREGWEDFLAEIRRKKITRQTKCCTCDLKAMCGMCPAQAELENGDPEEPVDFLCRVAHLRAQALGISVRPHEEGVCC